MPSVAKAGARQLAQAAVPVMGLPIDIDPLEALLHCVRVSAGEVEYCTMRVHALEEEQAVVNHREETVGLERGERSEVVKTSTTVDLNVWIKARQSAMERLAKFSKMAIDAGVAERQVELAEQMGSVIGRLIQAVLGDLGLTQEQQELAPVIVRKHLALIEGGS